MPVSPLSLTLIVATTPSLGIGRAGTLPWPQLRSEMAYFARVTRRVPPSGRRKVNAVLMGRKTWESIPVGFRPLKGRVNVVVSRSSAPTPANGLVENVQWSTNAKGEEDGSGVVSVPSLEDAVRELGQWKAEGELEGKWTLNRVFVIGGAELYRAALQFQGADRVLRTRILREFECDVHFPLLLGQVDGWHKANKTQLDEWTGESVPEGVQSEKDVEWEFEMWERV
jgi:dihydrofolate reductase